MNTPDTGDSAIAIIGMSCRFPGAKDTDSFWQNLKNGVESVSFFSDEKLISSGTDPSLLNNPNYVRANAVLSDIELFDASFFGFTPREAEIMDVQHRIFLECAWEAIESAGYDPGNCGGSVGVYAGTGMNTYFFNNLYPSGSDRLGSADEFQMKMSNDKDFLTTLTSYKLNLRGPSVDIQTACSTSLVAIHFACQSLLNGECDMALAGGVAVEVPQNTGYLYEQGMILSPDGHCRAFDAMAQGTVGGNGCGIVVLRRFADALADRDCIHAVITGTAINNDGSLKVGYTAPGVDGQADVIAEAQAVAETDPETITYVETHGTGTILGDPVEIRALTRAFRASTLKKGFCAIGSVKTNIGHADTAAGVAGLIKTVLSLKHKMIPPSLHFQKPNPELDLENSPFYVNAALSEWKTDGTYPCRAGVSSFGIGGTNAHAVLEETPGEYKIQNTGSRPWQLLMLSAKTSSALDKMTINFADYLKNKRLRINKEPDFNLADAAYTLQVGRKVFSHQRFLVCQNTEDAETALRNQDQKRVMTNFREKENQSVAFMFSGQGSQYVNMGLELCQTEPAFCEQIDQCSEFLIPHMGQDLRHILYPDQPSPASHDSSVINQTAVAQPALFVTEYALARLWMEWGISPAAMIGHSIGEYVAACLAGVFSLKDALSLVAARGQMMQQQPRGAMLAVPLPEKDVRAVLNRAEFSSLSLAAVNIPSQCVVSGQAEAADALKNHLAGQGLECRSLHTSHAFHSEMTEPLMKPFAERVRQISLNPPQIPYISNVTGTWITEAEATDPEYWARHMRQTVRFADGIRELLGKPDQVILEIGPGRTLTTFAMRHPDRKDEQTVLSSVRHPNDQKSDSAFLLTSLGRLCLAGVQPDWQGFYTHEKRHRLPLPTYPFERQRYWIAPPNQAEDKKAYPRSSTDDREPAIRKQNMADWFYVPTWKRSQVQVSSPRSQVSGPWLFFTDECGLGSLLVKQLEQEGQDLITVKIGSGFAKLNSSTYTLNPGERDGYNELLSELRDSDKVPETIVHLWNVTSGSHQLSFANYQATGFDSLLFLAQALGKQGVAEALHMAVISDNVQKVTGQESLCPEKATLLGPVRAIPQEYPNISCCSIDVTIPEPGSRLEKMLTNHLITELATGGPGSVSEPVIAYRGDYRWVQSFEPIHLPGSGQEPGIRMKQKGVYLITGGLGGIGLTLAEYLAKTVQARLILTGRSAFPAREEWEQWLAGHDSQDSVSLKIIKMRELEASGAEVLVLCADVADQQQMKEIFAHAGEKFGPVSGVIHAAGVPGGGVIQQKTREMAEKVLLPKVRGTLVLEEMLKNAQPPDFLILCSSLASVTGGFGDVDYCAANAFLDCFAHHKASEDSLFTVSVNWDAWQKVGMAADAAKELKSKIENRIQEAVGSGQEAGGSGQEAGDSGQKAVGSEQEAGGSGQAGDSDQAGRQFQDHPLFDRCITGQDPDQEIYISFFNAKKQWFLDEHRIMGKAVLPGTACLEIARAAFEASFSDSQKKSSKITEIREVYFLSPLIVEDDKEKEIRTILEKKENHFEFSLTSQWEGNQQIHARGQIALAEAQPPEKYEIKEIEAQCGKHDIIISEHKLQDELAEYGPRWNNLKQLKLGTSQALAVLELPGAFVHDTVSYGLHPALLDIATGCMALHDNYEGLPFYYKRLKIKGLLPPKIYSYIRYAENNEAESEKLSFNITIMDDHGTELIQIEEYTFRKINTEAYKYPEDELLTDGILPSEGTEVFRRILESDRNTSPFCPQMLVSTCDLQTRIEQGYASVLETLDQAALAEPVHPRPELGNAYVPPENETEEILARIWQNLLGIRQIGIFDNFFEMGGDSLLSVQMMSMIHKELGAEIALGEIFSRPTIKEMAEHICHTRRHTRSGSDEERMIQQEKPGPFTPLVSIQPQGENPPFFCVHPVDGNVLRFAELAGQLGKDQPFYGIQAFGLDPATSPLTDVKDMAAEYVKAIQGVQPGGPYLIGGFSMGATIAYETARQLQQESQVPVLINIDGVAPHMFRSPDDDTDEFITFTYNFMGPSEIDIFSYYCEIRKISPDKGAEGIREDIRLLSYRERLEILGECAIKAGILTSDISIEYLDRIFKVYTANLHAVINYRPRPYSGRILLFRATDNPDVSPTDDKTMGWGLHASNLAEVCDIPGSHHFTILTQPYVRVLAEKMKNCFDQVLK